MLITQSDVSQVLREARDFYKDGPKSLNKYYLRPTLPKHFKRNAQVTSSEARARADQTRNEISQYLYTEAGEYLYTHQIKEGNCVEMCFVIFYLCKKSPVLAGKIKNVYFVEVMRANHAFVLLVDRDSPARLHDYATIFDLVTKRPAGVWAIDCWMNIACACSHLMGAILAKHGEWCDQGKVVVSGIKPTGVEFVNHLDWSSSVIGSPLHFSRDPLFAS
jgi:hypothetical protein